MEDIFQRQTFRICAHLADSENPTISSGLHTLTKGKFDFLARLAASAVLPEFGGPSMRTETKPTKKN